MEPLPIPNLRQDYPAAEGWITVTNRRSVTMYVMIEPYGLGGDLAPGEKCQVHVHPDGTSPPEIEITDTHFTVYSGDAIYTDGKEVWDFI